VRYYNFVEGDPFRDDMLAGLASAERSLSSRYLFDVPGAKLYAALCEQPEHYLVRSEIAILRDNLAAIVEFAGAETQLIELRTGIGVQTAVLAAQLEPLVYVPIDIDGTVLQTVSSELTELFPRLNVAGMRGDILTPLVLPEFVELPVRKKVVFAPGALVGRVTREQATAVLRNARKLAGTGGVLLAGIDHPKSPEKIEAAYGDAQGMAAAWHLNLLSRINRELGGDFQAARFTYVSAYDPARRCMVMRLESQYAQFARVAGTRFDFALGEAMHAGVAYQYAPEEFHEMARHAGFASQAMWVDAAQQFSLHGLIAI
jgi:L-histidine N-alpha-methyltransferase